MMFRKPLNQSKVLHNPKIFYFLSILFVTTSGCKHFGRKSPESVASIEKNSLDSQLMGPGMEDNEFFGRPNPTLGNNDPASNSQGKRYQIPAAITALDNRTYRLQLREDEVWDGLLSILMKNYNIVVVDKTSGVITTEWDSYYVNNNVYRNKISLRLRKIGRNLSELAIVNNTEKLQDGSMAGTVGAVWLPVDDQDKEAVRIVRNLAIMVNQPPPVLAPEKIVRGEAPTKMGGAQNPSEQAR